MSSPYIVLVAVAGAVSGILVLVMSAAAMMSALYPDDLNDHKDD